jgi:hypothetical protein
MGGKTTKRNINQRLDGAHDNAHKEIKIREKEIEIAWQSKIMENKKDRPEYPTFAETLTVQRHPEEVAC